MVDAFSCFAVHDAKGNIVFTLRRYGAVHNEDRNASLASTIIEDNLTIVVTDIADFQVLIWWSCSSSCMSIEDGPCADDFGHL